MHFPRLLSAVVFALIPALFLSSSAPAWNLGPDLDIGSRSAILAEVGTGLVFFEKNPDRPNDPASVTKLLTLYVAFETLAAGLAHKGDMVTVSAKAGSTGGSTMNLAPGETVTVDELLHGIAIESGNDACVALAEYLMGSQDNFVLEMNLKADDLGMVNSFFMTPHGLTYADQQTTAADLLALARAYLERYPEAVELHKQKAYTHNGYTGTNKNPLLGSFEGADGLKTGYTGPAGYNLVATAKRGGVRLIAVVLGAPTPAVRSADAKLLLETGFAMSASSYMVNMGTFRTWDKALDMRDKLKLMGHRASLEETKVNRMPALRVLVGPYPDTDSALKAREVLQVDGFKPKFVVHRKRQGDDVRFSPVYPGQVEQASGQETDEPETDGPEMDGLETGVQGSDTQESGVTETGGPVDAAAGGEAAADAPEAGAQVSGLGELGVPESDEGALTTGEPESGMTESGMTEAGMTEAGMPESGTLDPGRLEPMTPESEISESEISESETSESGPWESETSESGTPGAGEQPAEAAPDQVNTTPVQDNTTPGQDNTAPGQDNAESEPSHTDQPALAPDQDTPGQTPDAQTPAPVYGIPELDDKLAGKKELGASGNDQAPMGPPAPQGWSDPTP